MQKSMTLKVHVFKQGTSSSEKKLDGLIERGWKVKHMVPCGENRKFGVLFLVLEYED